MNQHSPVPPSSPSSSQLKTIPIGDRSFRISSLPAHVIPTQAAPRDFDPYWGLLWESSIELASLILSHAWSLPASCIELGCGPGLAGIAAAAAGLQVTLTDLMPDAIQLALHNAALNQVTSITGLQLDWRSPPSRTFDVIIASDVLYDPELHPALLNTLTQLCHERSMIWIGDPGRESARDFLNLVHDQHWSYRLRAANGHDIIQPQRSRFQLIELIPGPVRGAICSIPLPPRETNRDSPAK